MSIGPDERIVLSRSEEETERLGEELGRGLRPGDVLLLDGELGSGKTTFVRGLARALGVGTVVRSPTFALMHRYRGRPDLVHVDLYRERDPAALEDLGLDACTEEAVVVVEWPRDLAGGFWPGALRLHFEHAGRGRRRIRIQGPARSPGA